MLEVSDLTRDHVDLSDGFAARRYFAKFAAITDHLARVTQVLAQEALLSTPEETVVSTYVRAVAKTFDALGLKYLLTGRDTGVFFGSLAFDNHESGFPVHREIMQMASDASQAGKHLAGMPDVATLKDRMLREIIGNLSLPTKLQFALSQRLYYEALQSGGLFGVQNDPLAIWLETTGEDPKAARRSYLVHWAVYDSQINLPVVYLLELEDTGRVALAADDTRWPEVQRHLMAQALGGLKLLTIARGFDRDFDDLHPKRLKRIHLGPMYSQAYTRQSGPIQSVLDAARAPEGQDWALALTFEELRSERVEEERKGWFGSVEREVFALDPFAGRGAETGATLMSRALVLPERPYQALVDLDPPGFHDVRKFVVSPQGQVLSYR
ncbi:hypothetical protein AQS8620_02771 [Aquimixticola soesokkakensis]|uniref:Uncharacterized protein n=1 Tax=Aquimixticola soesokkakensis TaxID=1519096 RepID=A0A1Y5TDC9_9RHOB|nr:hypothetical protein AQS8620_02771 [Aquimixticola soesokkakensis]